MRGKSHDVVVLLLLRSGFDGVDGFAIDDVSEVLVQYLDGCR